VVLMLHKDAIVQLTHDVRLRRGVLITKGSAGRVLTKITLHRACMVEFTVDHQTVIARVEDHDLAEVRPNARV
jgi:hypothetical protein